MKYSHASLSRCIPVHCWALSLIWLMTCCLVVSIAEAAEEKRPPNILLIVADDLGWSDVGWHDGLFRTPKLDALVRGGVELNQHYVQPVCTPTRTALMSGKYPGRFGPQALAPSNLRAMPIGTPTIASVLREQGYSTYLSGKWHLGARPEWGPNEFGFQESWGSLTGAADPWTRGYRKGPYAFTWHRNGKLQEAEGNTTDLVAQQALQWIKQAKGPWFIYVPFHAVHNPVDAPEEFRKLYADVHFHDDPLKNDSRRRLGAMVAQIDQRVGEFVAALDETKQRENTIIIFHSDNGGIESVGNPYISTVPPSPLNSENDPLRGQKGQLYEGGIRVCAFANAPSRLKPAKSEVVMHAVDWFPTLLAVAGAKTPDQWSGDGMNVWPWITGEQQELPQRTIYWGYTGGNRALRHGPWKMIQNGKGKNELYKLDDDPYEKNDLAAKMPERVEQLEKLLQAERAQDVTVLPEDLKGLPK